MTTDRQAEAALLRAAYVTSLLFLPKDAILQETRQLLIDVLDILEQTEQEQHVMAALSALDGYLTATRGA